MVMENQKDKKPSTPPEAEAFLNDKEIPPYATGKLRSAPQA
jgi:hypothetical protein